MKRQDTARYRIPLLIKTEPMNIKELSDALGVSRTTIGHVARQLHAAKKIHVAKWSGTLGFYMPCYLRGKGIDAPKPMSATEQVLEMLQGPAMSVPEMAEASGMAQQTITGAIREIKKSHPVRIDSWITARGPHAPRYTIGDAPDAPKPAPLSVNERVTRYRNTENGKKVHQRCRRKWMNSSDGKDYIKRHSQARYTRMKLEKHGLKSIDPLLAAIMGVR